VKFFIDSRILDMRNLKPKPKIMSQSNTQLKKRIHFKNVDLVYDSGWSYEEELEGNGDGQIVTLADSGSRNQLQDNPLNFSPHPLGLNTSSSINNLGVVVNKRRDRASRISRDTAEEYGSIVRHTPQLQAQPTPARYLRESGSRNTLDVEDSERKCMLSGVTPGITPNLAATPNVTGNITPPPMALNSSSPISNMNVNETNSTPNILINSNVERLRNGNITKSKTKTPRIKIYVGSQLSAVDTARFLKLEKIHAVVNVSGNQKRQLRGRVVDFEDLLRDDSETELDIDAVRQDPMFMGLFRAAIGTIRHSVWADSYPIEHILVSKADFRRYYTSKKKNLDPNSSDEDIVLDESEETMNLFFQCYKEKRESYLNLYEKKTMEFYAKYLGLDRLEDACKKTGSDCPTCYVEYPALDDGRYPIEDHFRSVYGWVIEQARKHLELSNRKNARENESSSSSAENYFIDDIKDDSHSFRILFHCQNGQNRSAALAAAFIMQHRTVDPFNPSTPYDDDHSTLTHITPTKSPNLNSLRRIVGLLSRKRALVLLSNPCFLKKLVVFADDLDRVASEISEEVDEDFMVGIVEKEEEGR